MIVYLDQQFITCSISHVHDAFFGDIRCFVKFDTLSLEEFIDHLLVVWSQLIEGSDVDFVEHHTNWLVGKQGLDFLEESNLSFNRGSALL